MVNTNSFFYFAVVSFLGDKVFGAPAPSDTNAVGNVKANNEFNVQDVLHFPLTKKSYPFKLLRKPKQNTTSAVTLKNQGDFYSVTAYVGSQKKEASVLLDTGSSDFWVKSSVYNPSDSQTSKDLNEKFEVEYGSGSITGEWYKDGLALSSLNKDFAKQLQLGVGKQGQGNDGFDGILGIGLDGEESTQNTYPNYPHVLANQGTIKKDAYSIYLGNQNSESGAVLFGGVDNAKYEGSLVKLPFSGTGENQARSMVTLKEVDVGGQLNSVEQPVLLDTGTTITMLPQSIVSAISDQFGSCPDSGSVTFKFDGVSISVPASDIASNSEGQCEVLVESSEDMGIAILGDNFLRHAYLVFDNSDKTLSLAQAKYTSDSDIQPIT